MGIKVDVRGLQKMKAEFDSKLDTAIVKELESTGKQCVDRILSIHDWTNQTGKLHSSVGCVTYRHGKQASSYGFNVVLNGSEGAMIGKQMAADIAHASREQYTTTVVAAMPYADMLEAKGRDVTSSTYLWLKGMEIELKRHIVQSL